MANYRKYVGGVKFLGTFQKPGQSPLDDRSIVASYADLTNAATFRENEEATGAKMWYVGMLVSVLDKNAIYMLTADDPTKTKNWKKIGADLDISAVTFNTDQEAVTAIGHTNATAGTYLKIKNVEGKYEYSKIDINLSAYATNASLNDVSSNLDETIATLLDVSTRVSAIEDASYVNTIKATSGEFVTVTPTTSSDGDVTINVEVTTKTIADSSADNNGLATASDVKDFVTESIGKINKFEYEVIASVDDITVGAAGMYKIYLVPAPVDSSRTSDDVYNEYIVIKSGDNYSLEKLGDTTMRLAGYATEEYVNTLITNNVNPSINRLDSSVNTLESGVSSINTSLGIVDTHLGNLDSSITRIDTTIAGIDASIKDIIENANSADEDIDTINTSVNTLETKTADIDASVADLSTRVITRLDSSVNTLETRVSGIDSSVNGIEESIDIINTSINNILNSSSVTSVKAESNTNYIQVAPTASTDGDVTVSIDASVLNSYNSTTGVDAQSYLVTNKYVEDRLAWIEIDGTETDI